LDRDGAKIASSINSRTFTILRRFLLFLLFAHASVAMADAYRCLDGGRVVISNKPCVATKVVQSDNPPAHSVNQASNDLDRQKAYLQQRAVENRKDQIAMQRHAQEVDRMYPDTGELVKPASSSSVYKGCGFGGSCPQTITVRR
jgi:hypothetical protein